MEIRIAILKAAIIVAIMSSAAEAQSVRTSRVYDSARHAGFTDLVSFNGSYFLSFREADSHRSRDGSLVILESHDLETWEVKSRILIPGRDLRDPKFHIYGENLVLSAFDGVGQVTMIWRHDGGSWEQPTVLNSHQGFWIWRMTNISGPLFGIGYYVGGGIPAYFSRLYRSGDGTTFQVLKDTLRNGTNEGTIRMTRSGLVCALLRREDGGSYFGISTIEMATWLWYDLGIPFGGPNFIITETDRIIAAGRTGNGTGVFEIELTPVGPRIIPLTVLPSGGDHGYPGLLLKDGTLVVSYYSSHEDESNIYLSQMELGSFLGRPRENPNVILSAYPNPAKHGVQIAIISVVDQPVKVRIFDILGSEVKSLFNASLVAGVHSLRWDLSDNFGRRVPSGAYFALIQSHTGQKALRLSITK